MMKAKKGQKVTENAKLEEKRDLKGWKGEGGTEQKEDRRSEKTGS